MLRSKSVCSAGPASESRHCLWWRNSGEILGVARSIVGNESLAAKGIRGAYDGCDCSCKIGLPSQLSRRNLAWTGG